MRLCTVCKKFEHQNPYSCDKCWDKFLEFEIDKGADRTKTLIERFKVFEKYSNQNPKEPSVAEKLCPVCTVNMHTNTFTCSPCWEKARKASSTFDNDIYNYKDSEKVDYVKQLVGTCAIKECTNPKVTNSNWHTLEVKYCDMHACEHKACRDPVTGKDQGYIIYAIDNVSTKCYWNKVTSQWDRVSMSVYSSDYSKESMEERIREILKKKESQWAIDCRATVYYKLIDL